MENFIKHEDSIEGGNPFAEASTGLKVMTDQLEKLLVMLKGDLKTALSEIGQLNIIKEADQKQLVQYDQKIAELETQVKQLTTALEKLKKAKEETNKKTDEEIKASIRARDENKKRVAGIENEVKSEKRAADSLDAMRANLKQMTDEYNRAGAAAAQKMAPAINKLTQDISKQEQSIGKHQRNVGNYPKLMQNVSSAFTQASGRLGVFASSIGLAGGAATGFIAIAAGIAAPFIAFFRLTEEGMEKLERGIANTKATIGVLGSELAKLGEKIVGNDIEKTGFGKFLELLATMPTMIASKLSPEVKRLAFDMHTAGAAASEFTRIMQELEEEESAASVTRSEVNRKLGEAKRLYYELEEGDKRRAGAFEEVNRLEEQQAAIEETLNIKRRDALQRIYDQLIANGLTAKAEEVLYKLNEAKVKVNNDLAASDERRAAASKKVKSAGKEETSELEKKAKDRKKIIADVTEWEKNAEDDLTFALKWSNEVYQESLKDNNKQRVKNEEELNNDLLKLDGIYWDEKDRKREEDEAKDKAAEERKKAYKEQLINEAANVLFSYMDYQAAVLDAQYDAEVKAAGDNEAALEAIEKKYAEKKQKIAIGKALIDAAQAIVKVFSEWGWPAGIPIAALIAAQTGIQVATIKKQKFAEGGSGLLDDSGGTLHGRSHAEGGVDLGQIGEAERGEYFGIVNKSMTGKYKNILPEVFNSLNKGEFENVWGRAISRIQPVVISQGNDHILRSIDAELKKMAGRYSVDLGGSVMIVNGNKKLILPKKVIE